MNHFQRLLVCLGLLAAIPASAEADDCICFHYSLDKDGNQKFEGSHSTKCGTHTHADGLSLSGPTFEPNVMQSIMHNAGSYGRISASPSLRYFFWVDKGGNPQSCVAPDIARRGETQPARTASAATTTITFSLTNLPATRVEQARLAANAWNRALAALGKKTRFLEVSDNANVRIYSSDISKVTGTSYNNVYGVTWTIDPTLNSHPGWLVPSSAVVLNSQYDKDFAADPMLPVQLFGHEFGHVLGLADVIGHQLMSGATQYTSKDDVVAAMAPGTYEPNLCEVAKVADNGLP